MKHRGFTLVELLLAVGVISVLASTVIVAVNPGRQLAQARNAERRREAETILNAVQQNMVDSAGSYASGISTTLQMLGTADSGCNASCSGGSGTGTLQLYPVADATIREDQAGTNYGSTVDVQEYPWEPNWSRRFLVQFDLSSIPSGAQVKDAQLFLHESGTYGSTRSIGAYRIGRSWTEGEVTWSNADSANAWDVPGGDFSGTPTGEAILTWDGILGWNSIDVRSDVDGFVKGTWVNRGWLIKDVTEDDSQAYWFFHSREEGGSRRPYLSVTYSEGGSGSSSTADACLDLSPVLVPTYLSGVPTDPSTGTDARSRYAVQLLTDNRLLVRACAPELGETIEVQR